MPLLPVERKVFVLMPFEESFNSIYEDLIKDTFCEAGYFVYRADDITSHQNILRDIVMSVANADVVVADLTDSNPNVYYELGLAHALHKPVVLLTQDVGSVPFDLRSYRIIEYNTRFDQFPEAKAQISKLAHQISRGEVVFGNPVSDFGGGNVGTVPASTLPAVSPTVTPQQESDQQPGYLDSLVEVEEGFAELSSIILDVGDQVTQIGNEAMTSTPEIQVAVNRTDVRHVRNLLRSIARKYEGYVGKIKLLNERFRELWTKTENALEMVLTHVSHTGHIDDEDTRRFLTSIKFLETNAKSGKDSLLGLIQTMNAMSRMERTFDRARIGIIDQLNVFVANIDRVISLTIRVRGITGMTGESDASPE